MRQVSDWGGGRPRTHAQTQEMKCLAPRRIVTISVTAHTMRVINPQRPDKSECNTIFTRKKQVGVIRLYLEKDV